MEQTLIDALQQIRHCRNNMTRNEFHRVIDNNIDDNNVLLPLIELSTHCTMQRLNENAKKVKKYDN
jgi:hypothetical protein